MLYNTRVFCIIYSVANIVLSIEYTNPWQYHVQVIFLIHIIKYVRTRYIKLRMLVRVFVVLFVLVYSLLRFDRSRYLYIRLLHEKTARCLQHENHVL